MLGFCCISEFSISEIYRVVPPFQIIHLLTSANAVNPLISDITVINSSKTQTSFDNVIYTIQTSVELINSSKTQVRSGVDNSTSAELINTVKTQVEENVNNSTSAELINAVRTQAYKNISRLTTSAELVTRAN